MQPEKKSGFLQKSMEAVGRLIEQGIGQAKKAKKSVEAKSGLQPILSLESRLPLPKIRQLIDLFTERFVPPSLPNVKDKAVLEMGEWPLRFSALMMERRPKVFCGAIADGPVAGGLEKTKVIKEEIPYLLRASFKSVPFEDQFFDLVICRLASPHQGDVISSFKELGRLLMPEGVGLVVDYHPFGGYAKSGTERLRSVQATIRGLEDYFKVCQMAELAVTEVREGFVDDTLRNQFTTPQEMAAFRELKGTPLVLFLKVKKQRK